jgi:hypothetical protein
MNSFVQHATQPANGLDAVPSRQRRSMTSSASRFRAGLALALAAVGALALSSLGLGAESARAEVREDGASGGSLTSLAPVGPGNPDYASVYVDVELPNPAGVPSEWEGEPKPSRFERVRAERFQTRDLRSREFRERLEQDRDAKARSVRQFRKRVSAGREAEAKHGAGRKPPFEERIEGGSE